MLIEEGNQVSGTLCCVSRLFRDGAPLNIPMHLVAALPCLMANDRIHSPFHLNHYRTRKYQGKQESRLIKSFLTVVQLPPNQPSTTSVTLQLLSRRNSMGMRKISDLQMGVVQSCACTERIRTPTIARYELFLFDLEVHFRPRYSPRRSRF